MNLPEIMFVLQRWCASRNIPAPVKVTITFNDYSTARYAFDHLKMDANPLTEIRDISYKTQTECTLLGTPLEFNSQK